MNISADLADPYSITESIINDSRRINIWKTQNNKSLRNLQEVRNTIFFFDKSESKDNLIEYTGPKVPMEADKISIPNSSTNINH